MFKRLVVVFHRPPRKKEREWLYENFYTSLYSESKDVWTYNLPTEQDTTELAQRISENIKISFKFLTILESEYTNWGFYEIGKDYFLPMWSDTQSEQKN